MTTAKRRERNDEMMHEGHEVFAWWNVPYKHDTHWDGDTLVIELSSASSGESESETEYWCECGELRTDITKVEYV
jgi:hypothetical protein